MSYVEEQNEVRETNFQIILAVILTALLVLVVYILMPSGGMSRDEYRRIHEGMTIDQVMKIVGEKPKSIKSATFLGSGFDVYTWKGEDIYDEVTVTFSENVVIAKLAM